MAVVPISISGVRAVQGVCPSEPIDIVLKLFFCFLFCQAHILPLRYSKGVPIQFTIKSVQLVLLATVGGGVCDVPCNHTAECGAWAQFKCDRYIYYASCVAPSYPTLPISFVSVFLPPHKMFPCRAELHTVASIRTGSTSLKTPGGWYGKQSMRGGGSGFLFSSVPISVHDLHRIHRTANK